MVGCVQRGVLWCVCDEVLLHPLSYLGSAHSLPAVAAHFPDGGGDEVDQPVVAALVLGCRSALVYRCFPAPASFRATRCGGGLCRGGSLARDGALSGGAGLALRGRAAARALGRCARGGGQGVVLLGPRALDGGGTESWHAGSRAWGKNKQG